MFAETLKFLRNCVRIWREKRKESDGLSDKKRGTHLFWVIREAVRFFYPKTKILGMEKIPEEPCVIIGNHAQLHGPIVCELYLPDSFFTWCAGEMMKLSEVPSYAYHDFWSQKPKWQRPFFKVAAFLIAPLSVVIFNNARTIAVHKDHRLLSTFRESVLKLQSGKNLVIFPEQDKKNNHIVYDFQEGFVDLAKIYHSRTGKELLFVPMYMAPKLKQAVLGDPIRFSSEKPIEEERKRICGEMMNRITRLAEDLPFHTVIPYRNIPKRLYSTNIPKEEKK